VPAALPDLTHSLQTKDPGFLKIVLELWAPAEEADAGTPAEQIVALVNSPRLVQMIEALPAEARTALEDLVRNEGKLPWAMFARRYGAVREMGAGRREREKPHQEPSSPAEMLWYRMLIDRAFLDTETGPQEFGYIPIDVLQAIPPSRSEVSSSFGRAASPAERAHVIPANDRILDNTCTLLAALRLELPLDSAEFTRASWDNSPIYAPKAQALQAMLAAAELLEPSSGLPLPEPTRRFLELPREKALALLARTWRYSSTFNELRQLPDLSFEGEWQNDPLRARSVLLELLASLPRGTWRSLPAFVAAVKRHKPDFQRPAGDYDSWFIRSQASGEYLRGFAHWDAVDGALIRYLICGPLHWLGIFDLAAPEPEAAPTAFRFSRWAEALLSGAAPQGLKVEDNTFLISSDARLRVPHLTPRAARYLLARFCTWDAAHEDNTSYRITAASLQRARQQGLRLSHLLALLRRHALSVPPSLARALERWDEHGSEARLERVLILRLRTPEILQTLRNSRAARFLGDPLGPTTVIVKQGASEKVLAVLAELGYIGEIVAD
jgi:hypothetical protein